MSSWTFSVPLSSQPPVKCLCFSILCKLCQKQFFGTDVHIWREMNGCRLFKVLSHRLFFFFFYLKREVTCTRSCTSLELWKSRRHSDFHVQPCPCPLGWTVCFCFVLLIVLCACDLQEDLRTWKARPGGYRASTSSSLSNLPSSRSS